MPPDDSRTTDPYKVLGVGRTAGPDEIRKAFRRIAKANHPDLNPGDSAAEERFKAANAAHDLLSDPARRARYDRGEIDAAGQEVPPRGYYRDHAEGPQGARYAGRGSGRGDPFAGMGMGGGNLDPDDLESILGMFRSGDGAGFRAGPRRGRDANYRLAVDFLDAVNGATTRLTLPDGGTLDVRIPPGLEDGQVLRLRGKGAPGAEGGAAGDALIEVAVGPHPFYERQGRDLLLELPVTMREAVLGAKVPVPTPRGEVTLTVPPRSDSGAQLRLRGRGVAAGGQGSGAEPAGDLLVTLRLVLGPVDARLEEFLRDWTPEAAVDPREEMRRKA
ncbi:DnaJ C-terminal domain-containing protein [Pararoseomonas indoligenes]|uniref:DnaJ domain-containing protein n=1 Tax=Roseomonas indoligenes TaxID=2820811 RepID=A0A940MZJ1_9PROT|nr:DnaJ C-terminal domain-containing protein [Pararoseomonas indoligenes]MBP0493749.1 DnaJ domain-containing protein [Pararoseomonas indoligenes]